MRNKLKLVMLPGMDGTSILFSPIEAQLSECFEIHKIVYSKKSVSIDQCFEEALSQIPNEGPLLIVAESFSGLVAAKLSSLKSRIVGVVFCASFTSAPNKLLLSSALSIPLGLFEVLARSTFAIKAACLGFDASAELIVTFRKAIDHVGFDTLWARLKEIRKSDMVGNLSWLANTPCLYLQGASDLLVPKSSVASFASELHNFNVVTVNGPHFLMQSNPTGCSKAIYEFTNCI